MPLGQPKNLRECTGFRARSSRHRLTSASDAKARLGNNVHAEVRGFQRMKLLLVSLKFGYVDQGSVPVASGPLKAIDSFESHNSCGTALFESVHQAFTEITRIRNTFITS
jgi:hypothetical protein